MSRALAESLAWLRRQAASYLLILLILLAGGWLLAEYRRAAALASQEQAASALVQQREQEARQAGQRMSLADQALAARFALLREARDAAHQQLQAKQAEADAHRARHWPWAGLFGPAALAQARLLEEQVAALRQAVQLADARLDASSSLQQSAADLARLQRRAHDQRLQAQQLRAQERRLDAAHPLARRLPWSRAASDLAHLDAMARQAEAQAERAQQMLAAAARSPELADWLDRRAAHHAAQAALREAQHAQAALAGALESNRYQRLKNQVAAFAADKSQLLLVALLVLLGAMLSRLGVKLLLYYGVAPFAARRAPVRLLGPFEQTAFAQPVAAAHGGRISAESITLQLQPSDELLVRPEYLQSSSEASAKRTAWLFHAALPFTSLLSGLYLLTRVRAPQGDTLVLSPASDPFDEIAAVELAPGAALVCHPRSLAGVVQPLGQPMRISRHWRIGSLHAWLTMQLRFLVFHGPCTLVLKGRRGIRMEAAGRGRLINQGATLGFDASVPYGNARTETFVPYWLGKDELFNDRFGGIDGSYLYEERPLDRRGNALVGRGLQGLLEGVFKVFGL